MSEKNKEKKAKLIPNSANENNFFEESKIIEDQFNDPFENLSNNFRSFKRISGWWILGFLIVLFSIPLALIYLAYIVIKSVLGFIF
tara:strand:- start:1187 stop:1444 length:258 start_codon:yes stop_codon:yes gene_type:complete